MEELLSAVSQTGFPIAVAVFMMWSKHQNEVKHIQATESQNILLNELKLLIGTIVKKD